MGASECYVKYSFTFKETTCCFEFREALDPSEVKFWFTGVWFLGVVVFSMCLNWMEWLQVEYALSTPSM